MIMEVMILVPVNILLLGHLRQLANNEVLSVSVPARLDLALGKLCKDHPVLGGSIQTGSYMLVLNGVNLLGQNLQAIDLKAGDELAIIPFVGGG
jgi:molybdopterin converting factor small subunit